MDQTQVVSCLRHSTMVQFSALVRTPSQRGQLDRSSHSGRSQAAYGTPVSVFLSFDRGQGLANEDAHVALSHPGQLSAAFAGPYRPSAVHYTGGGGRRSVDGHAWCNPTARAGSTTEGRRQSHRASGKPGPDCSDGRRATLDSVETPTGTVSFSVWKRGGQPIPCQAAWRRRRS